MTRVAILRYPGTWSERDFQHALSLVPGVESDILWHEDADLAGYLVYRSTTAGRGHAPLTASPQGATTYVDADARPGQTYFYVVTAVDRARRANESVPSPEAAATLP